MNPRQRQNLHTAALCVVLSPFAITAGWGVGYALELPAAPPASYVAEAPSPSVDLAPPVLPAARELTREAAPTSTRSTPPTASVPRPAQVEEPVVTEPSTEPEPVAEAPVQDTPVEDTPIDETPVDEDPAQGQEEEQVVMPTPDTPIPRQPTPGV